MLTMQAKCQTVIYCFDTSQKQQLRFTMARNTNINWCREKTLANIDSQLAPLILYKYKYNNIMTITITTTKSDIHATCDILFSVPGAVTNTDGQPNIRRWLWKLSGGLQVIIPTICLCFVRYLSVELVDEQRTLSAIYE